MPRKRIKRDERPPRPSKPSVSVDITKSFHLDFLNPAQELAWQAYQQHDLLFLLGPAGTGKTHLATGFAIYDILQKVKKNIVITRPVVEAGESLGYLPGDFDEKILPYMMPVLQCIKKVCGASTHDREIVNNAIETCPLAYMRGRTFDDAVFLLDEAQNCTHDQLILALTRLGFSSKMIVTGDPDQSDLPGRPALEDLVAKVSALKGVGVIRFKENSIVRHPLVGRILKRLGNK